MHVLRPILRSGYPASSVGPQSASAGSCVFGSCNLGGSGRAGLAAALRGLPDFLPFSNAYLWHRSGMADGTSGYFMMHSARSRTAWERRWQPKRP
eukprot:scaffold4117_cov28-Prasinocladus_malaysianus.AAC.2